MVTKIHSAECRDHQHRGAGALRGRIGMLIHGIDPKDSARRIPNTPWVLWCEFVRGLQPKPGVTAMGTHSATCSCAWMKRGT